MSYNILRRATEEDLAKYSKFTAGGTVLGAWIIKHKMKSLGDILWTVIRFKTDSSNPFKVNGNTHLVVYSKGRYKGYAEKGEELDRAINDWELKKNLSPNTAKTFGDIIDEL